MSRGRVRTVFAGLLLGALLPVSAFAGSFAVNAVQLAPLPDRAEGTRVTLNLTGLAAYRVFTLADPLRVVIDLADADWAVPAAALATSRNLVAGMRYGRFNASTSRLVLDLSGPATITRVAYADAPGAGAGGGSANAGGFLLNVDIAPGNPEAFQRNLKTAIFTPADQPQPAVAAAAAKPPAPQAPAAKPPAPAAAVASSPAPVVSAAFLLPAPRPQAGANPEGAGGKRKPLIIIDPGHGGVDPGAMGDGAMEKNITLAVAKALKQQLLASGRFRVKLTRETDVYIPLRDRFRIAREAKADLFISLHADSHPDAKTRGASVYTLSEQASDAEAEALAAKENKSDIIAGVDLSGESGAVTDILIDLAQRETKNLSSLFADNLVAELQQNILMLDHSHRFAGFAVLKAPDVPSALLEMGYISSGADLALLSNRSYQKRLAGAINRAVQRYFQAQTGMRRT